MCGVMFYFESDVRNMMPGIVFLLCLIFAGMAALREIFEEIRRVS